MGDLKECVVESKEVIRFFQEISKIPRKSGEEEAICNYLENFAKERNLEYERDEVWNIVIRKMSKKNINQYLGFQAHTDMICEKEEGYEHDFSKDSLKLYKEGDFIKAKGTTLGADNGIGVAFLLAILDSKEEWNSNIEAIFTVQEETTMQGVIQLDEKKIKSRQIISLDNGKEGKILVSAANCKEWEIALLPKIDEVDKETDCYELSYLNFKGGHSGGNIGDESRGNPIKLSIEAISEYKDKIQIIDLKGGTAPNVIPRDMQFKFTISKKENMEKIEEIIKKQKAIYGEEVEIKLEKLNKRLNKVYSKETSKIIIEWIETYPNGALKRNENDIVILSSNLAYISDSDGKVKIGFSMRSNQKGLEEIYQKQIEEKCIKNEMKIQWYQELKGVYKKENSKLVEECKKIYEEIYRKPMEEVISSGTVEGGFLVDKIKDCEYVTIGPNTFDVHSPKERLSISSVERTWKYIKKICKDL